MDVTLLQKPEITVDQIKDKNESNSEMDDIKNSLANGVFAFLVPNLIISLFF